MSLTLHNYFRSSTSTRLRAAMNLKGLDYDYHALSLLKGDQRTPDYLARNPAGLVPALELDDGTVLTQSLAIMEWLEETHPEPPLLPADPLSRARLRALSYMIACEVHPINNLRVLQYLDREFDAGDQGRIAWFRHWVATTFAPLETQIKAAPETGTYLHGDTPGFADCVLFAQVLNNRRFEVDMTPYPVINRIFAALETHPAFAKAAPANQPDAL